MEMVILAGRTNDSRYHEIQVESGEHYVDGWSWLEEVLS